MQLLVLRARSSCALCRSKLPPRTEAWQRADAGDVICVTCERMERAADTPPAPAAVQGPPPVTPPPVERAVEPVAVEPVAVALPPVEPVEPVAVEPVEVAPPPVEPVAVEPPPVARSARPASTTARVAKTRVPKTRVPKAPTSKTRVLKASEPRTRVPKESVPKASAPKAPASPVSSVQAAGPTDEDQVGGPAPADAPTPAAGQAPPSVPVHHASPVPVAIEPAGDAATADRAPQDPGSSKVALLRPSAAAGPTDIPRADNVFDRVLVTPGEVPTLDPAMALPIRRGDVGEGRVGQTLEGARIQGLEVLHGVRLTAGTGVIDHLVVSANGLWVVGAVPVLDGRLERRDLGDWFNADPRLFVADDDRSELVAVVRRQVEAATAVLARGSFSDIPVRGVLCFGSVQPGWVKQPFVLDGVSVTWRSKLVEPMLSPVLVDLRSRTALLHALAASVVASDGAAGDPSRQVG